MGLSLFSYGTLQPGQHNWSQISYMIAHVEPAQIQGFELWHFPDRGYPAIIPSTHATLTIQGSLCTPREQYVDELWRCCDLIEGVERDLYQRIELSATPQTSAPRKAGVYVYHPDRLKELRREGIQIESERWVPSF